MMMVSTKDLRLAVNLKRTGGGVGTNWTFIRRQEEAHQMEKCISRMDLQRQIVYESKKK